MVGGDFPVQGRLRRVRAVAEREGDARRPSAAVIGGVKQAVLAVHDIQGRVAASFQAQGLMSTLGAQLASVADGEVQIAMPFAERLCQQHGYVHAGAIASIVDSACGYAALTRAPPDCNVVTAEFKINFLRPAIGERFLAIGRVQSSGKLLAVCTGEVRAYSGTDLKVVAIIQATVANVRS